MSKKGKIILGCAIVLVLALMIVINLRKARGDSIEVQTEKIQRQSITQSVRGTGRIQPVRDVNISAFVSAEIIRLHIREGDQVNAGQLLVELDRTRLEASLERAVSNAKSAKATLRKANSELTRAKELHQNKLYSESELERMQADFELAESQVEQAEAAVRQAQDDLSKSSIHSPLTGTVTQLFKEEGEIALGSQFQADVIMTVADLTEMEMVAEIDENDVVLVSNADSAKIEVDALPDLAFDGNVSHIAHTATTRGRGTQEEVTNFEVRILISGDTGRLRPGMSATVDIYTETHENAICVPIQAVTMRQYDSLPDSLGSNGRIKTDSTDAAQTSSDKMIKVVFIANEDEAQIKEVETGISSEKHIEILTGIDEDQEVITGGYRAISKELKHGSKIKVGKKAKKDSKE